MTTRKLDGKVAIITGSGRGIGRALALKLASEGAKVVVNDLEEGLTQEVVTAVRERGGSAVGCAGDITASDFGDRFVQTAVGAFGGLDIIINNAGYTHDGVIQNQKDAQFQSMLEVHLIAPFRILRAAAEPIRIYAKQEALEGRTTVRKIVNVSSMAGINGVAGQVNYSSAKASLVGLTKSLSKEWGRYHVCVNCVAFGFIETRLTRAHDEPESRVSVGGATIQAGIPRSTKDNIARVVPFGRAGSVDEAAGAIYLLCTPESDYISGQVLTVSGGL